MFTRLSCNRTKRFGDRFMPTQIFPLIGPFFDVCSPFYRFSPERIAGGMRFCSRTLAAIAEKFTIALIDRHGEKETEKPNENSES